MGKYNPVGKYVVYIKSPKDNEVNRARALVKASIGTRCTLVDEFIESKEARKNYKPELTKAINKCNEKDAHLLIPDIGHLPRSLAFCNEAMKLEGRDPFVVAIRECDHRIDMYTYHSQQMLFQCMDHLAATSIKAKEGIARKKKTGWKAGNRTNLLDVGTPNASKAREKQANDYCKEIIPIMRQIQRYGKVTLQEIANALMARNIKTRRGKEVWTPMGVSNILNKAKKLGI
jgi:hypothetical protein